MKAMTKQMVAANRGGDHDYTKPAHIKAVIGAGHPVTKPLPQIRAFATLESCGHSRDKSKYIPIYKPLETVTNCKGLSTKLIFALEIGERPKLLLVKLNK